MLRNTYNSKQKNGCASKKFLIVAIKNYYPSQKSIFIIHVQVATYLCTCPSQKNDPDWWRQAATNFYTIAYAFGLKSTYLALPTTAIFDRGIIFPSNNCFQEENPSTC